MVARKLKRIVVEGNDITRLKEEEHRRTRFTERDSSSGSV